MVIKAVDALSNKTLFLMGSEDELMPSPNAGDIFVTPDGKQYRCLQRAYITRQLEVETSKLQVIGEQPKAQTKVGVELQYAVCPLGMEAKYDAQLAARFNKEANNARS